MKKQNTATKRRVKRRDDTLYSLPFYPVIDSLEGKNFCTINDLSKIVDYHFETYKIPFINSLNSTNQTLNDFRGGKKFQRNFASNIEKYGDINNFYVSIFLDDTKICKKKVKVCYLTFLNDLLCSKGKSLVYSITTINYEIFNENKNGFYQYLVNKLIKEIELVHDFKNFTIKGNIFSLIVDNLESMDCLCLVNNFISNYQCRICHTNVENVIDKLDNFAMKSNNYYLKQIKENCKKNVSFYFKIFKIMN
jgi:hypothetical protein